MDCALRHLDEQYITTRLLVTIWAFSGDAKLDLRAQMGDFLRNKTGIDLPPIAPGASLLDYDVQVASGVGVFAITSSCDRN